jgi:cilia- and flagella-associated protein 57
MARKIFASCSEDNTVKIWNYFDSDNIEKQGILEHRYSEEPIAVSLHPSSMFIAVCFNLGFIVAAIMTEELNQLK